MGLKSRGFIDLPEHVGPGGFDHASIDRDRGLLHVAHTANDSVDVIDTRAGLYVRSITGLKGVAGVLVDEREGRVFTSNRGEDTVAVFPSGAAGPVEKFPVGVRPNGLAYDRERRLLLCANVGDPERPGSASVTLIDLGSRTVRATFPMPGRTRWAIFDPARQVFFVNIADPFRIVAIDPVRAGGIAESFEVAARGPHGLDLDASRQRLYCACDDARLECLDSRSGTVLLSLALSGPPDVVFLDPLLDRLYVSIGDPGVIDVIDVAGWRRIETVPTEPGAHTHGLDPDAHRLYAFLPHTHRAAVFDDRA